MNEWPTARLADCCRIVSGATPQTGVDDYWNGEIEWATPKDLSSLSSTYITATERRITAKGLASCSAEVLPPRSVLFSSRAPIGHVAINTRPMATNQGFKSFVPDERKVHPEFLYYWLRYRRQYLESLGSGATFKEVSKAVVARIEIPLPPLGDQKRIAAILDAAEALREKRRQAIAVADALAGALFADMFVSGSESSAWPNLAITDLLEVRTGKLDSNAAVEDGPYPFFTCGRDTLRIDRYAFDCEALLLAGNNATGDYTVKQYRGKFNAYQRTYVMTLRDSNASYEYARYALQRRLRELKHGSKGTNTKYLTMELLSRVRVRSPSSALQRVFSLGVRRIEQLESLQERGSTLIDDAVSHLETRAFRGAL